MKIADTLDRRRSRSDVRGAVPAEILQTLRGLARRMRWVALVRGTAAAVAVTLASLLLMLAADWLVTTSSPIFRWSLSLLETAIIAISVVWFVARPLCRRLDLAMVARWVEMQHPELHERVSSTFELLSLSTGDRASRGSEQLIGALAADAISDVRRIRPRREIRLDRAWRFAALAAIPTVLLALCFACWPRQAMILLTRLVTPYRDQANVHALDLVIEPPGKTIPVGDPLTISIRSSTAPLEQAQLICVDSVGRESLHAMQHGLVNGGNDALTFHWESVPASFRFRIRAGRALTAYYPITCVPRPTIARIDATLTYPRYTNRAALSIRNPSQPIEGLVGSEVDLIVTTNTPQLEGSLRMDDHVLPPISQSQQQDRGVFRWRLKLDLEGSRTATLSFRDALGLTSLPASIVLRTIPDAPPRVAIIEPAGPKVTLPPDDHLAIVFDARDDFGISRAELMMAVDGAAPVVVPPSASHAVLPNAPHGERDGLVWRWAMILDLGAAVPAAARAVEVRVRVADTRAKEFGGPQTAESRPLRIVIRRGGTDYADQKIGEQTGDFRRDLAAIIALLRRAKAQAVSLRAALATVGRPWQSVDKVLQSRLSEADHQLAAAADGWQETLMARFAPTLRAVADEEVRPAHNLARSIELTSESPQRIAYAAKSDEHIARALERLTALLAQVESQKGMLEKLAQLEELALREQRLAELADEQKKKSGDAEKPSSDWREQQQQLAKETSQLAQKSEQETAADAQKPMDTKPMDMKPSDMKPMDMKPDDKTMPMKPMDMKPMDMKPMDGDKTMMNDQPSPPMSPMLSPSPPQASPETPPGPQQPTPPMQGTPPPTDAPPAEDSMEDHSDLVPGPGSGMKGEAVGGMGLQKSDGPKPMSGFGSTPLDLQGPGAAAFGKGSHAEPGTMGVGAVGPPMPGQPAGSVASALTDASDSANAAASSSSNSGAESAARKSADSLATAAQAVAKAADVPSVAGALAKAALANDSQVSAAGTSEAMRGQSPRAENGSRPWALFRGRSQAGQAGTDMETIPLDYRDLTGRYFKEMSKLGTAGRKE